MARTSRNSAHTAPPSNGGGNNGGAVDALDNLNLDDMFADGGDDLFDGLDIDLGNMDDLTNGGVALTEQQQKEAKIKASGKTKKASRKKTATAATATETVSISSTVDELPKRRKTKRKIKSPGFFDHDDNNDDASSQQPPKPKKRKTAKVAALVNDDNAVVVAPPASSKKKSSRKSSSSKAKDTSVAHTTTSSSLFATTISPKLASSIPPPLSTAPTEVTAAAATSSKKKSKSGSLAMPPPIARSTSGVAAAGQFGGRLKRGNLMTLPTSKNKKIGSLADTVLSSSGLGVKTTGIVTSPSSSAPTMPKLPIPPPLTSKTVTAETTPKPPAIHPGLIQDMYCGLPPSDTLFYPFLPSLPSEPSIKNRKLYPSVDRVHTTFMGYINSQSSSSTKKALNADDNVPALESEPIFTLMQDGIKDEKVSSNASTASSSRSEVIGKAIGSIRQIVSSTDKEKLAGDLLAVCALLKRQHDFLNQNLVNMEKWCKSNFSSDDYTQVYNPEELIKQKAAEAAALEQKRELLSSFKNSKVKVNLFSSALKERRNNTLFAILPITNPATPVKKTKKRKLSAISTKPAKGTAHPVAVLTGESPASSKDLSYSQLRPIKRRQAITDMVARAARDLESMYLQRIEERIQLLDRQENELLKFVEKDNKLLGSTTGMWKWLEKAGYFSPCSEDNVCRGLDGVISPDLAFTRKNATESTTASKAADSNQSSHFGETVPFLADALFVNEDSGEDDSVEIEFSSDDEDSSFDVRLKTPLPSSTDVGSTFATYLRDIELFSTSPCTDRDTSSPLVEQNNNGVRTLTPPSFDSSAVASSEIETVVDSMVEELISLNSIGNKRAAFLEYVAQSYRSLSESKKYSKETENAIMIKYQHVLKKAKEHKAKIAKMKVAKVDDALPW